MSKILSESKNSKCLYNLDKAYTRIQLENDELRRNFVITEKANSEYSEMISKMDAKNMQLTAERNLYKNELQKVRRTILPLENENEELKQNSTRLAEKVDQLESDVTR